MKLRIRGPYVGGLWKCYHEQYAFWPASGMTPEQAWNNYWSIRW